MREKLETKTKKQRNREKAISRKKRNKGNPNGQNYKIKREKKTGREK